MAIRALSPGKLIRFVPVEERDEPRETQGAFMVKVLTAAQRRDLDDLTATSVDSDGVSAAIPTGTLEYETLRAALGGWENIVDDDGNPLEFKTDKDGLASDASIGQIPPLIVRQIANFAARAARLEEDDEGN